MIWAGKSVLFFHVTSLLRSKRVKKKRKERTQLLGLAGDAGAIFRENNIHVLQEGVKTQAGLTITHSHREGERLRFSAFRRSSLKAILSYEAT